MISAQLKKFLGIALERGSSDLHISVGQPPTLRISRVLTSLEKEEPLTAEAVEEMAFSLMNEQQKEKFLREKEIDFSGDFNGQMRFRANLFIERGRISLALRLIPSKIRTIEELGLPFVLHKISEAWQGFVLVTGASSQGKSTTLAALIDEINHRTRKHIITIEDPIEYVFTDDKCLIHQREVGADVLSFARGLRSALREDPDVIMVGEMRDLETISTAITAAETGHLVLATLHTNSASQTIHRIIDAFPPYQQNQIRAQLSGSLLAVISQQLVPARKSGVVPVCEIMFNNAAISNLIRENKIHEIPTVIETSREAGMNSFNKALFDLVKEKKISRETAISFSPDPKEMEERLGKKY